MLCNQQYYMQFPVPNIFFHTKRGKKSKQSAKSKIVSIELKIARTTVKYHFIVQQ